MEAKPNHYTLPRFVEIANGHLAHYFNAVETTAIRQAHHPLIQEAVLLNIVNLRGS